MYTFNPSGLLTDITKDIIDYSKYEDLDPTFVSRYLLQAAIINPYGDLKNIKKLKVLDVGGAGSMLGEFIDIDLTIIDIIENENAPDNYIVGSALEMPFKDKEFDVVISCDVLEHIKKEDRRKFLEECSRVSKDLIIIAAPFNLTGVRLAEISANDFYRKITGQNHIWLEEHLQDELPELYQTKKILKDLVEDYGHFSHTALDYWQLITRLSFFFIYKNEHPDFVEHIKKINEFYLEKIMNQDFSATGYRSFIIASKTSKVNIVKSNDAYNPDLERMFTLITDSIPGLI